jgi:hypothetical protein
MTTKDTTVNEILAKLPADFLLPFNKLHNVIVQNLPKGF